METTAFCLIMVSAVIHAVWNLMAKQARDGKSFVWLSSALILPIYLPAVAFVILTDHPVFGATEWIALGGATLLHLAYFIALQTGYKIGDFSQVYPVARGTGPLLSSLLAMLVFHEEPTMAACAGILLILSGVFVISGGRALMAKGAEGKASLKPILYGVLTGLFIASYTLWDKFAVANIGVSPVLLDYSATAGISLIMLPYALKNREKLAEEWRDNKLNALGVAALSPAAFLIVLFVLKTSPVYFVAPLREVSILFAAIFGARLLKEGNVARRFVAASIMFAGVVTLAMNV